jgi:hypothetical protein
MRTAGPHQSIQTKLEIFLWQSPKCILGGLFYILGYKFNSIKTRREIADFLYTTEDSIRNSFKNWLIEFPQIFTDFKALKRPKVAATDQSQLKFK